jgi:hypothetical protein
MARRDDREYREYLRVSRTTRTGISLGPGYPVGDGGVATPLDLEFLSRALDCGSARSRII